VRRWARSAAAGAINAGGARCGDVSGGREKGKGLGRCVAH
jgi:hypothetical protein